MREEIQKFFKGEVLDDSGTLDTYSRDASIFEVQPKLVVYPKDSEDLQQLVRYIAQNKEANPELSLTIRAAGSDMTGGSLNDSIIVDVTKYMNKIGNCEGQTFTVAPGVFYRDFELKTLNLGLILPCYPASKDLAAIGGMVGNNCGGERSLRYGKMEDFVLESKYIFSDGREYPVKPLSRTALDTKMVQGDFEGNLYKEIYNLLEDNKQVIQDAKPKVSKNSSGYFLWNVVNEELVEGSYFDLNKLLTGSQGTLGLMTEAKLRLVPDKKHHDMVALFFKSWDELPKVVNAILPLEPEDLETFDKNTLKLGIRFMPEVAKKASTNFFSFASKFLPEALLSVRMLGLPELVVLVEIAEDSEDEVKRKVRAVEEAIKPFSVWHRVVEKDSEEEKFWIMRRESFNLLREHSGGKRTAPFVEDFCVPPDSVPEFLPKAKKILEDNGIDVNIAGHAGNGNFHIIPLMDLTKESERAKLIPVANAFYDLVAEYKGTISGEHNDGIVRTPYLGKMYSPEVLELFKKTKKIFDPLNIFNPGKKVPASPPGTSALSLGEDTQGSGGTLEYLEKHLAIE